MNKLQIHPRDTIIFDVDDTLGHFTKSFDLWLSNELGMELPDRSVFSSYSLIAPYEKHLSKQTTAVDLLEVFEDTGRISEPDHFLPTSVVEFAKQVQCLGFNTMAMTARGWMLDGKSETDAWLKKLGISMPVHVLSLHDSKAKVINNMRRAGKISRNIWVFEDNLHHIQEIERICPQVNVTIVTHPHNQNLPLGPLQNRVDPNSTAWISSWPN